MNLPLEGNFMHYILRLFLVNIFLIVTLESAPIKIMPLGDSITEGMNQVPENLYSESSMYGTKITPENEGISYRGKLFDLLKSSGYDFDFVGSNKSGSAYAPDFDIDHEGHGGQTTVFFKNNIGRWLDKDPDIVLLHVGVNDAGENIPMGRYDDSNTNSNTSINNIRKILDTIFSKNLKTKVFIARIITAKRSEAWGWDTNLFNNKVEDLISNYTYKSNIKVVDMERGAGLNYDQCGIDMHPRHEEDNGSYDLHPNKHGYSKMAQTWFNTLQASGWLVPGDRAVTPPTIGREFSDIVDTPPTTTGSELIKGGAQNNLDTSKWKLIMSEGRITSNNCLANKQCLLVDPYADNAGMYQAIPTEVGKTYKVTATLIGANHYEAHELHDFTLGSSYITVDHMFPTVAGQPDTSSRKVIGNTPTTVEITFTAKATTSYISLRGDTEFRYPNALSISVK